MYRREMVNTVQRLTKSSLPDASAVVRQFEQLVQQRFGDLGSSFLFEEEDFSIMDDE